MKIIRWMGLRKCRDKLKVPIIVNIPRMERTEAQRSTMVRMRTCPSESDIATFVTSVEEYKSLGVANN
jgi:hypothetical protein